MERDTRTFRLRPQRNDVRVGTHDYYVLLRWIAEKERYEGYMLSGRAARDEVQRAERFQSRRIREGKRKGYFPSISVGGRNLERVGRNVERRADEWRNTWLTWTL